jgi:hypothetical protein
MEAICFSETSDAYVLYGADTQNKTGFCLEYQKIYPDESKLK